MTGIDPVSATIEEWNAIASEIENLFAQQWALDKRAHGRTTKPQNELALPLSWHRSVFDIGGAVADHDSVTDERLVPASRSLA